MGRPYPAINRIAFVAVWRGVAAPAQVARFDLHAIQHQRSGAAFPRRGRSTKSAASSASLRSVLRGVPICARMVRPRAKSSDLACADGHRKVGRDFSRADRVPETTFHQRCRAGGRVLQELPDLSVVHKRRDAHEKTSPSGSFLGRSFRRRASGSRRASREESAARGAPSRRERPSVSAYALRTRKNNVRLSPKTAYRLGRPTPIPATRSSIVTPS